MLKIKGINFEESFAPVARLEQFGLFRAYAAPQVFIKSMQMDVNTDILNGLLKESFMLLQQKGSLIPDHPEKVYLLRKSFVWIKSKLQEHGFSDAEYARCLETRKSTTGRD
ncbi:retrovirus-related pol polyprotein from transposon TNT 1-94 [Tanacetum coccineum]